VGVKSFEVMGNISINHSLIQITGFGVFELESNFILVNESGGVFEGRVLVTTGEYILKIKELVNNDEKNNSVVNAEEIIGSKSKRNLELGVGIGIILILIVIRLLAPI